MKTISLCILLLLSIIQPAIYSENIVIEDNIIYVGGSGEGNYTSIQEAINNAQNNWIIYIYPTIYNENIVLDKSISIIGLIIDDKRPLIIGEEDKPTINITSNNCTIQNLSIANRNENNTIDLIIYSNNNRIEDDIFLNSETNLKLINSSNNIIVNNEFNQSLNGIILSTSNYNLIENNILILSEEERIQGQGISLSSSNYNYLRNNTITSMEIYSNREFGIYLWISCDNTISNNTISGNNFGILIHSYSNSNNISYNMVYSNTAYGVSIQGGSSNIVKGNRIYDNKGGSGISILKSWSKNNIIVENIIYNNPCGIQVEGTKNTIKYNTINNNSRYGIYLNSWLSNCKRNIVEKNNLIDNNINAYFQIKPFSLNKWYNNYWSDWNSKSPKPIYGKLLIPITPFFGLEIPWINFDTQPSLNPN